LTFIGIFQVLRDIEVLYMRKKLSLYFLFIMKQRDFLCGAGTDAWLESV